MKIYKYIVETQIPLIVDLPRSAKVIHCHEQGGKACIWILLIDGLNVEIRKFYATVTGIEFGSDNDVYCGTCHLDNSKFVTHIFESK